MAVRGEEVSSSVETHVRESIARMVSELRSSVDDIRVAVDQQLKAALQSVQADVNAFAFPPQVRSAILELEQLPAPEPAVSKAPADASRLRSAVQAVERGKSQVEVLNALLEQSQSFGSRAALLIVKNDTFTGWKGVGFAAHGGSDETIKRFVAGPGNAPRLDQMLREERSVSWDGADLSARFGVTPSDRAVVVPMVIKDKISAVVYVDAVGEGAALFDEAAIELLVFTTGLLIDTLAIRKRIPSPTLSGSEALSGSPSQGAPPTPAAQPPQVRPPAPAPPAPARPAAPPPPLPPPVAARPPAAPPASRPSPPPAARPPAAVSMAAPASESTVAISPEQIRQMMGAPGVAPPRPPVAPPTPPPAPPAAAAHLPVAAPPAAHVAPPAPHAPEDRASTQFVPPAGFNRGGSSSAAHDDEAKRHDEARRFARLLVSEIKLYNESKVDLGRKNRDLYDRMKDDIDRSRQMYDERISEDVRKVSNYFYDELVRILADGSPDALGL
jgi:hypothetical protein